MGVVEEVEGRYTLVLSPYWFQLAEVKAGRGERPLRTGLDKQQSLRVQMGIDVEEINHLSKLNGRCSLCFYPSHRSDHSRCSLPVLFQMNPPPKNCLEKICLEKSRWKKQTNQLYYTAILNWVHHFHRKTNMYECLTGTEPQYCNVKGHRCAWNERPYKAQGRILTNCINTFPCLQHESRQ